MQKNKIIQSILNTLAYSDVFDYPLTKKEILKFYIGEEANKRKIVGELESMVLNKQISKRGKLYFLNGKENLFLLRREREKISNKKLRVAEEAVKILSIIPTIEFIGVSGSLSMKNTEKKDDIDLFIITSENSLWTTRIFVNALLVLKGFKRSRNDSFGIDRICPNMFVAVGALNISRNIFSAHEIVQVKPMINRNKAYERFINSNLWVLKYMPNSIDKFSVDKKNVSEKYKTSLLEEVLYRLQYSYMKKRITTESVSRNIAKFHPKDKTKYVIDLYKNRTKSYQNYLKNGILSQPQNAHYSASEYTPGY